MNMDGKAVAAEVRESLKARAARFEQTRGRKIGLAVVLVEGDAASEVYVRNKSRACAEVGISSRTVRLPADCSQEEAERTVRALAKDGTVDGVLVQLPLPSHLDSRRILACIPTEKDVDGFSAENFGKLAKNEACLPACTPRGVMELLARYGVDVRGKRAVIVGRSNIVGRPMALLLLNADATVTVCHSKTNDLREECLRADILVAAIGRPAFITADMVKEGAVVIDVGINRTEHGLVGDVDYPKVCEKASLITPVPGGVGPMTVAMLLLNTVEAAERAL